MISFALHNLRHRKASFAGAFLALLCAAALVCAFGMLLETGLRGTIAAARYAGTPVIVAGDQNVRETIRKSEDKVKTKAKPIAERAWIAAGLADRLRALPGVTSVVTEVTFPAYITGVFSGTGAEPGASTSSAAPSADAPMASTLFLGHGWESSALTPFTVAQGRAPKADDEVVTDAAAGLRVGSRVTIQSTAEPRVYRVVGVTAQALENQPTLFFLTAEARRLAGHPGLVSAIGVFPATEVTAALKDASAQAPAEVKGAVAVAYTGEARGPLEFLNADKARIKLISLGGALGGTSLLVAIIVVVGTFALSIQQRLREIALLRAVAATPRQIRKMIGAEALLISLPAGAIGAALGLGLGFWLQARFVALSAIPVNLKLVVSPFPIFAAVLATVVAAWTAARVSARRTARVRPVEALGDAALAPAALSLVRVLAGLGCIAGGVTLTIVLSTLSSEAASNPVTMLTALLWTVAVALLGPVIARILVSVPALPLRASGAGGYLAAANLRTGARRLASVIAPLTLMVTMTCTILFVQDTTGHAVATQQRDGTRAAHVLGPHVSATAVEAVRHAPGVTAVTEILHTTVRIGLAKHGAQAVTPTGLGKTMDLGVRSGSIDLLAENTVAVSETLGFKVGDQIKLTLGDGTPAALKVVATYTRNLGFGDLTLAHSLVAAHVDNPLSDTVLVTGSSPEGLAKALRNFPGIMVADQATVAAEREQAGAEINYVAMGLIIAFTVIAVGNTLAMATSDRTREFALLRLVGTTRRQILRMLRLETLSVVAISVLLGTAAALITISAFSSGMTGSALPYISPLTYALIVVGAAILALAATGFPARLALDGHPAETIGARE
ncbi:putative ABC transport system permease protein [Nonomuraea maritima]|uniref:Putative ABC transport system permease protein n=1 Tax=Nonomuraea maritima TaxID=683260 RepID=A0A1G9KAT7_9ACTN|nr:FtsX-like permease family protein [Nonomuraea maritima]SDL46544.1 putative ABC transport system permease protein [Nonomuraea maritima]